MKKIVFILVALMFAAPALADVDITMAQVEDTNEVIISITSTETNLVRAYALDIKLTQNTADPEGEVDPHVLEVTALNAGYWVFPGTIQINADGDITNPGTPVAEYGDLQSDTLGGLDSNGVTVELASLYAPPIPTDQNAPVQDGALLSVKVSGSACITITANVSRAGASGLVMENPDEDPVVTLPAELCIIVEDGGPPPCIPIDHPDYDEWVAVGEPPSWCYERQCRGDSDDAMEGSPFTGYYYVGINDLQALINVWKTLEPPDGPGITIDELKADFSHSQEGSPFTGYYRVGIADLNILIANWKVLEPPDGPGIPADCLIP